MGMPLGSLFRHSVMRFGICDIEFGLWITNVDRLERGGFKGNLQAMMRCNFVGFSDLVPIIAPPRKKKKKKTHQAPPSTPSKTGKSCLGCKLSICFADATHSCRL